MKTTWAMAAVLAAATAAEAQTRADADAAMTAQTTGLDALQANINEGAADAEHHEQDRAAAMTWYAYIWLPSHAPNTSEAVETGSANVIEWLTGDGNYEDHHFDALASAALAQMDLAEATTDYQAGVAAEAAGQPAAIHWGRCIAHCHDAGDDIDDGLSSTTAIAVLMGQCAATLNLMWVILAP